MLGDDIKGGKPDPCFLFFLLAKEKDKNFDGLQFSCLGTEASDTLSPSQEQVSE